MDGVHEAASLPLPTEDIPNNEEHDMVPESDDEDVCAELAELFGEEVDETPPQSPSSEPIEQSVPAPIPGAEKKEKQEQARPGILERLLAKEGGQLSSSVAGIVHDARVALGTDGASAGNTTQGQTQASRNAPGGGTGVTLKDIARKRKRRQDVGPGANGAVQKKARNAFAVLGRAPEAQNGKLAFDDPQWTGMKLRDCSLAASSLDALFEAFTVVNIAELADKAVEVRSGAIRDALVFGALVRKAGKRTAKDGGRYAVWTLANMPLQSTSKPPPLTTINCLLFDTAFENHHTAPEGTVFAIRAPTVLPPRERDDARKNGHAEHSGLCISVRKADAVVALAHAADYATCDVERPGSGARCGQWFHKGYSSRCHYHTRQLLKKHTQSARMVINNAVRPGADTKAVFRSATAPVNVSERAADAGHIDRYAATMVHADAVQIARAKKDDRTLRSILAARTKHRNTAVRARVVGGERAKLASYRTARKPTRTSTPSPKSPQDKLIATVNELVGFGYRLAQDGTLHPPNDSVCAKHRIDVTNCVYKVQNRKKQLAKKPSISTSASTIPPSPPDVNEKKDKSSESKPEHPKQVEEKENGKPEIDLSASDAKVSKQEASERKVRNWLKTATNQAETQNNASEKPANPAVANEVEAIQQVGVEVSKIDDVDQVEIELSDSSDED